MKAREVIRKLKEDGWYQIKANAGSHLSFRHPEKPGKVTVPFHTKDLAIGTVKSIYKQAGWK